MKTIITLDKANQPYGYPQLDGSGNLPSPYGRPYKVYTALLTQNGGSNPQSIGSGPMQHGVTYYFTEFGLPIEPWDFSNVGGPVYPNTNSFVATSTATPNSYGTANMGYNTGAPVVTVLENTIGNIWFDYIGPGQYFIISDGLFTIHKTLGLAGTTFDGANAVTEPVVISCNGVLGCDPPNSIDLRLIGGDYNGDSLLSDTPIEIRVYN